MNSTFLIAQQQKKMCQTVNRTQSYIDSMGQGLSAATFQFSNFADLCMCACVPACVRECVCVQCMYLCVREKDRRRERACFACVYTYVVCK